ncbi:hypothetical protein B0H94_104209 [Salsuginibacillus halophilus]|uniref:Flagellar protein FliT n=1 Tax=Salsuginibacillus halophilus TaxID=517424 RepID=A0A2P8HQV9_9BACI|nr:hypothetical protein [Salsuginibacillus halophilus]PSL48608.1 hypothetical protein B0H94_104209 [Salsuginibacillus halophilus]
MTQVKDVYMATKKLWNHVRTPLPEDLDARDKYIVRMNTLLERRRRLLDEVGEVSEATAREQRYIREMFRMNQEIEQQMNEKRFALRSDYNWTKHRRTTGRKYKNPYDAGTPDGIFFDKKN